MDEQINVGKKEAYLKLANSWLVFSPQKPQSKKSYI